MKKLFKFRVYEKIVSDMNTSINLVYEGHRWGVSEQQVIARVRYTNNFKDHDEKNGSEAHYYVFIFENEAIEEKQIEEEHYTEYGYKLNGIEFATIDEAEAYFR